MTPLIAPFQMAAVLLAIGGALKVVDPADTARALGAFGLPARPVVVRAGGAAELAVALWALMTGNAIAVVLVGASYALFAAFVGLARHRRLPIASCGCFGKADTPPSGVHLGVNIAAVLVATGVALHGGTGFLDVLRAQPLGGVPYGFLVVLGVWLAFVALTELPRVLVAAADSRGRA